jgi:hypothetical protein
MLILTSSNLSFYCNFKDDFKPKNTGNNKILFN